MGLKYTKKDYCRTKLPIGFGYWITLVVLCIATVATAQKATLRGTIVDESGESLPGATVMLTGTLNGSVTNIDGDFVIVNVPVATQSLKVSYVGFSDLFVDLVLSQGSNDLGQLVMEAGVFLDAEVIVTAQVQGQQVAIQEQLASDALVNIVSADKIQELPDENAAAAIARLPGVGIQRSGGEAQKVIIRGLSPKFAAVTLNGVRLPSNSSTDRSVDLSLITPEMLSGIEVYKSPLPSMDAESTAGSVNLKMSKAPKRARFLVKGLGGYNGLKNTYTDYKGLLRFSNRFFDNKFGVIVQGSTERFNRSSEIIDDNWDTPDINPNVLEDQVGIGRVTLRDRQEIRIRHNANFNMDINLGSGHSLTLYNLFSRTTRDRNWREITLNNTDGTVDPLARDIENSLNLYSATLAGEHPLGQVLMDWSVSQARSFGETPYDFQMRFDFDQNSIWDNTLRPASDVATRDQIIEAFTVPDEAWLARNEFASSSTEEVSNTYLVNFKLPVEVNKNLVLEFNAGGKYFTIDRKRNWSSVAENFYGIGGTPVDLAIGTFDGNLILTDDGERIELQNFVDSGSDLNPQVGFDGRSDFNIPILTDPGLMRNWYNDQKGNLFDNFVDKPEEDYDLRETVVAAYGMVKIKVGDKLTVIPGFRYEYSDNTYNALVAPDVSNGRYGSLQTITDTTGSQSYGEFFPHLHAKFQATDWLEVRASYATTIARPDFTYLIPRVQINRAANTLDAGNNGLRPMLTTSYDLSFSTFKNGLGLLTIGGFYKDITDLFISQRFQISSNEEAVQLGFDQGVNGYTASTFVNLGDSYVYGFEMDIQTNLAALPAPWNGVVINFNLARQFSGTTVFDTETETVIINREPITTVNVIERDIEMPDQVPWLLRTSLGYDYKGLSLRFSATYQASKLRGVNREADWNSYDISFWRLDAAIKQNIDKNWTAFLNLNNLSNQQDVISRNRADRTYEDLIETYGMNGQLGIQFTFNNN